MLEESQQTVQTTRVESLSLLQMAEIINTIMIDMMPGLFQVCCQRYTAEMVKLYFRRVR